MISIHDGQLKLNSLGKKIMSEYKDLMLKHYHMELVTIQRNIAGSLIINSSFQQDDSLTRKYGKIIEEVCEYGCSENFGLECPMEIYPKFCLNLNSKIPRSRSEIGEATKIAENNVKQKFK